MSGPLAVATIASAALITALAALPGAANASPVGTADLTNRVSMNGEQEVPGPGDPNGYGTFTYQVKGSTLCYTITDRRIEPATKAHIHKGEKGVAGPITVTLKTPTGGSVKGCVKSVEQEDSATAETALTQSELRGIVEQPQQYYVNVHNDKYPDGAIRGQL